MIDDLIFNSDYSEECDYNFLKKKVADVLRRYFECDDNGDHNSQHDPNYAAQQALDDIHEIIGEI